MDQPQINYPSWGEDTSLTNRGDVKTINTPYVSPYYIGDIQSSTISPPQEVKIIDDRPLKVEPVAERKGPFSMFPDFDPKKNVTRFKLDDIQTMENKAYTSVKEMSHSIIFIQWTTDLNPVTMLARMELLKTEDKKVHLVLTDLQMKTLDNLDSSFETEMMFVTNYLDKLGDKDLTCILADWGSGALANVRLIKYIAHSPLDAKLFPVMYASNYMNIVTLANKSESYVVNRKVGMRFLIEALNTGKLKILQNATLSTEVREELETIGMFQVLDSDKNLDYAFVDRTSKSRIADGVADVLSKLYHIAVRRWSLDY